MELINILKFIWNHPLSDGARAKGIIRFLKWQIFSRIIRNPIIFSWIDDARLIVQRGMTGATGCMYVGLYEFDEMAFVLHYLRPEDVFFDIGANIGSYTILASKVIGAETVAWEPDPKTFAFLKDNIAINGSGSVVQCLCAAAGGEKGESAFVPGQDAISHIKDKNDIATNVISVKMLPVDYVAEDTGLWPEMIKIDTEGYESEVVRGGTHVIGGTSTNVVQMELRGHGSRYGFDESVTETKMRRLGYGAYSYNPFARSLTEVGDGPKHGEVFFIRDIKKATERVRSARRYQFRRISL